MSDDWVPTDADAPAEDGGREQPHDVLAERSTLGGMMLSRDGQEIDDVTQEVTGDQFYDPKHQVIFRAIVTLHAEGKPTDVIAVTDELTRTGKLRHAGGGEYLHQIVSDTVTAANAGYYASLVKAAYVSRELIVAGMRIVAIGHDSEGAPEELLSHAHEQLDKVTTVNSRTLGRIDETLRDVFDDLEAKPDFLVTPWDSINSKIVGLKGGELCIIGARPGEGKSIVGLMMGVQAARKGTVAYVSIEMQEKELQSRLLSQFSEVSQTLLRRHDLTDLDWNRLNDARQRLTNIPLFVDDNSTSTVSAIRSHARAVARKGPLAAVVVDYIQKVKGEGDNRNEKVASVSWGLKRLAKELDVPVIALAQLGRGEKGSRGVKAKPGLHSLRESGDIEQDADLVMLLHRDAEKQPMRLTVIIAKARHGDTGTVQLRWEAQYSRVRDPAFSSMGALWGDEKEMQ